LAFCAHAILDQTQPLVVPNAHLDPRFVGNPLVVNPPHVTFYAGIPLGVGPDRLPVGTLCVIDQRPRTLAPDIIAHLTVLARQVEILLNARLRQHALEDALVLAEARKREDQLLAKVAAQVTGMVYQFLLRPDGSISFPYSSEGIRAIYGMTPSEAAVSAQFVVDHLHPDDRERVLASIGESAKEGTRWTCAYRYCHPDGALRWLQGQSTPETLDDGSILWHGFITDIGEKKGLEELLQQSTKITEHAQRTAQMFQSTIEQHSITSTTDAHGIIQTINDAFCLLSGYTRDELIGKDHRLINSGIHERSFWAQMWSTIRSGKPWRAEVCNRAKNGSLYWVDTIIAPFTGESGQIERIISIRMDITARKNAEQELQQVSQRLTLALSGGDVGTWDYDVVHNTLTWDALMYQLYGIAPDQFAGAYEAWHRCVHPDDQERSAQSIAKALSGEADFDTEFRVVWPDGSEHVIRGRALVQRDATGKALRMIGTNWDITDNRRQHHELMVAKEKAEAASKAKAEFLAVMSHEIRTPMNGVIGMTNLLVKTKLDAEQREYAETVRSCGESLLTLINDIMDFSKLEAGRVDLECIPFSPAQILEEVVMLFTGQAEQKSIHLAYQLPANLPARLMGDPTRLRQILQNLLSNALKFTLRGRVDVRIESNGKVDDRYPFLVVVRDTGIGMTPEQVARMGEAFTQADSSTTRRFGGSGLGMTITKALIHLMHGTIQVESIPEQATTFRIGLDLAIAPTAPPSHLTDRHRTSHDLGRQQLAGETILLNRVLIAEDAMVNQRLITAMMKHFATTIDVVDNGAKALAAASANDYANDYDCVLMDCQMPEMDGYQATREIREREQRLGLPRIPIIALTAHAMQGAREECLAAGMDDYLSKPLRENDLIGVLERRFGGRAKPDAPSDPLIALRRIMDENDIRNVAAAVVDEYPRLLLNIERARANDDRSGMARLAHSFKGSAAGLELETLKALASAIESHAEKSSAADLQTLVDRLKHEAQNAITCFAKILAQQPR
jgi:PAS domain S-box-containing protein